MSNDEKLLKALAVAIVDRPRATLKDLAEAAGVSKATLHRFCGTRDSLVERLMNHSQAALNQVIEDADLQVADVAQALRNLIENHLRACELFGHARRRGREWVCDRCGGQMICSA
ncbi:HTH-type transcriptional regulator nfxB [Ectopseudomonas oleovorans CECT 5344]|uniref:HTH-type transcriptional regulator nfxB n=1 Tax=Ectopseudomonas oleovorans (strain CECT 5344) TaxID=1182590 RepID=W6R0I2_ECTO5|nr:HTH-type transcriptional regulator nfxB [Pseudomonas oleovorans CECT 5344]